ncbi:hypothetical protein BHM03_00003053 [Ensete ventricosum]|nr:hypothetical protein BHM03_00003053 [Ensete ventricosum]
MRTKVDNNGKEWYRTRTFGCRCHLLRRERSGGQAAGDAIGGHDAAEEVRQRRGQGGLLKPRKPRAFPTSCWSLDGRCDPHPVHIDATVGTEYKPISHFEHPHCKTKGPAKKEKRMRFTE